MRVSYGPPGHQGVTHLMAIGADEVDQSPTDLAVQRGLWLGIGVALLGVLVDAPLLRGMGAGAAVACGVVRYVTGANGSMVPVTQVAPTTPVLVASGAASGAAAAPISTSDYFDPGDTDGWL
jgi:hypothetical protein